LNGSEKAPAPFSEPGPAKLDNKRAKFPPPNPLHFLPVVGRAEKFL